MSKVIVVDEASSTLASASSATWPRKKSQFGSRLADTTSCKLREITFIIFAAWWRRSRTACRATATLTSPIRRPPNERRAESCHKWPRSSRRPWPPAAESFRKLASSKAPSKNRQRRSVVASLNLRRGPRCSSAWSPIKAPGSPSWMICFTTNGFLHMCKKRPMTKTDSRCPPAGGSCSRRRAPRRTIPRPAYAKRSPRRSAAVVGRGGGGGGPVV